MVMVIEDHVVFFLLPPAPGLQGLLSYAYALMSETSLPCYAAESFAMHYHSTWTT
jgi:hypothetical protein